jgi:hypothetical protein
MIRLDILFFLIVGRLGCRIRRRFRSSVGGLSLLLFCFEYGLVFLNMKR